MTPMFFIPLINNGIKFVTKYTNAFISVKKSFGIFAKNLIKPLITFVIGSNNIINIGMKSIIIN